jgi:hypothetical protein
MSIGIQLSPEQFAPQSTKKRAHPVKCSERENWKKEQQMPVVTAQVRLFGLTMST